MIAQHNHQGNSACSFRHCQHCYASPELSCRAHMAQDDDTALASLNTSCAPVPATSGCSVNNLRLNSGCSNGDAFDSLSAFALSTCNLSSASDILSSHEECQDWAAFEASRHHNCAFTYTQALLVTEHREAHAGQGNLYQNVLTDDSKHAGVLDPTMQPDTHMTSATTATHPPATNSISFQPSPPLACYNVKAVCLDKAQDLHTSGSLADTFPLVRPSRSSPMPYKNLRQTTVASPNLLQRRSMQVAKKCMQEPGQNQTSRYTDNINEVHSTSLLPTPFATCKPQTQRSTAAIVTATATVQQQQKSALADASCSQSLLQQVHQKHAAHTSAHSSSKVVFGRISPIPKQAVCTSDYATASACTDDAVSACLHRFNSLRQAAESVIQRSRHLRNQVGVAVSQSKSSPGFGASYSDDRLQCRTAAPTSMDSTPWHASTPSTVSKPSFCKVPLLNGLSARFLAAQSSLRNSTSLPLKSALKSTQSLNCLSDTDMGSSIDSLPARPMPKAGRRARFDVPDNDSCLKL